MPRVLIVAEHASARFGGEAALPLHYYRVLRQRGVPVWLVTHERTRKELEALFPDAADAIRFVPDTSWHRFLWRLGRALPDRISVFTTGFLMRLATQMSQRTLVRRLVREKKISVIHQPMPVSPKEPSLIYDMGAPVVIGPMNGGMNYPPAFRKLQSRIERIAINIGRGLADVMNTIIPGKRKAALLLVANERTRAALPRNLAGRVEHVVENGVDLTVWQRASPCADSSASTILRCLYMGRLIALKAVDLLLLAFQRAASRVPVTLSIVGDGPERSRLERLARRLDLRGDSQPGAARFLGWMPQTECAKQLQSADVLVLPSLMECGGAVVLEAMASRVCVIAAAWGGPADYLDASCGILVEPASRDGFIDGLAAAMVRLATSADERLAMGKAAQSKAIRCYDWNVKAARMVDLYGEVMAASQTGGGRNAISG